MGFIIFASLLVGGAFVWFLYRDARQAIIREAVREASRMNLVAVNIELESLNNEWKRVGILSEREKAFMEALHCRRIELLSEKS